jgi:hypothetical protein
MVVDAAIAVSLNRELAFSVREVTIHFLEEIGSEFGKYLAKKQMTHMLQKIIECGFSIAAESTEDFADD